MDGLLKPDNPRCRLSAEAFLMAAVLLLGAALQVNYGQYHPRAMVLLSGSLIALLAAARRRFVSFHGRREIYIGLACVITCLSMILAASPTAQPLQGSAWPLQIGVIIAMLLGISLVGGAKMARAGAWIFPALYFICGLWVLRHSPPPPVDICVFQHDSCAALLHGANPYAIDFPNLYDNAANKMYGPGLVWGGRVHFGYPYPPLSLLMTLPGYLLGDFRLAHLAAMTLAGLLIGFARPGAMGALAGALFLFTPRAFFVVEAGFTEPLVCLLLAATIFAAYRKPKLVPFFFGLLLVSKQYMILAAPLGFLLFQTNKRSWLIAAVTGGVVTLPFLVSPGAFVHSVVTLQFHQPLRSDSLSYFPGLMQALRWPPLMLLPFAAAGGVLLFVLRKFDRTPAAFCLAIALVFMIFFATNKQAFCGYYLLVLCGACGAIATTGLAREREINKPADIPIFAPDQTTLQCVDGRFAA